MSIDIVHFKNILEKFKDVDFKYRLDEVSVSLWYVGITRNKNASFFDNDWMLFEITNGGTETAGNDSGDTFERNWNDRATYSYSLLSDIILDNQTVSESNGIGSLIGNVTSSGGRMPVTYSVSLDVDGKHQITGSRLELGSAVTYPNTHDVTIRATDADNKTLDKIFTITITEALSVYSLDFNGVDEGANDEAGSVDSDLCGANFSVATWIKLNNSSTRGVILNKWQSGKSSFILNSFAQKIEAWVSPNGSSNEALTSTASLSFNTWHHVVMTFAPNSLKIYINGTLDSTKITTAATIYKSTAQVNMGFYTGVAWSFDGRIKEALCYNKTLSLAEVQTLYNAGSYLSPTDPSAPSGLKPRYNAGDSYHLDGSDYKFNEETRATKMICFGMDVTNQVSDTP